MSHHPFGWCDFLFITIYQNQSDIKLYYLVRVCFSNIFVIVVLQIGLALSVAQSMTVTFSLPKIYFGRALPNWRAPVRHLPQGRRMCACIQESHVFMRESMSTVLCSTSVVGSAHLPFPRLKNCPKQKKKKRKKMANKPRKTTWWYK